MVGHLLAEVPLIFDPAHSYINSKTCRTLNLVNQLSNCFADNSLHQKTLFG